MRLGICSSVTEFLRSPLHDLPHTSLHVGRQRLRLVLGQNLFHPFSRPLTEILAAFGQPALIVIALDQGGVPALTEVAQGVLTDDEVAIGATSSITSKASVSSLISTLARDVRIQLTSSSQMTSWAREPLIPDSR